MKNVRADDFGSGAFSIMRIPTPMNVRIIAKYGKKLLKIEPNRRTGFRPRKVSYTAIPIKPIGKKIDPKTTRAQKIVFVPPVSLRQKIAGNM